MSKQFDQVEITHFRRFNGDKTLVNAGTVGKHRRKDLSCKGGLTTVSLVKDGKIVALGQAGCSELDNFNRRLGTKIAMGRAMKSLKKKV